MPLGILEGQKDKSKSTKSFISKCIKACTTMYSDENVHQFFLPKKRLNAFLDSMFSKYSLMLNRGTAMASCSEWSPPMCLGHCGKSIWNYQTLVGVGDWKNNSDKSRKKNNSKHPLQGNQNSLDMVSQWGLWVFCFRGTHALSWS